MLIRNKSDNRNDIKSIVCFCRNESMKSKFQNFHAETPFPWLMSLSNHGNYWG